MHKMIRGTRFQKELAKMVEDYEQVASFVAGVEWGLRHDPTIGKQLPASNVWCISTNPTPQLPHATVYYTFGKTVVVLVSIVIIDRNGDYP